MLKSILSIALLSFFTLAKCQPSRDSKNNFTSSLLNKIKNDQIKTIERSTGVYVLQFFNDHPGFNILNAAVISTKDPGLKNIPAEKREKVISELKTLQRIAAISTDVEVMTALLNAGFNSAEQIAKMDQNSFIQSIHDRHISDSLLKQVHHNAKIMK